MNLAEYKSSLNIRYTGLTDEIKQKLDDKIESKPIKIKKSKGE